MTKDIYSHCRQILKSDILKCCDEIISKSNTLLGVIEGKKQKRKIEKLRREIINVKNYL